MFPLDVARNLLEARRQQWLEADSLESLQRERLRHILDSASKTEHYGNVFKEASLRPDDLLENLDALPLTDKESLRHNPFSFIPRGMDRSRLTPLYTSGSTGDPVRVHVDAKAMAWRVALVYSYMMYHGRSPYKLFADVSCEGHPDHPLLKMSGLFPRLYLPSTDDEAKNFSILSRSGADMLRSYPSILTVMAKMNNNLSKPIRFGSINSSAEMLSKDARDMVESSFSCPIYQHYGAMEVRSVAFDCPEERSLHVNGSSCILEIVDGKGKPKKSGRGEIAVTCLHNPITPLLRYRIGDYGSWGKECACGRGFKVLGSLEGRATDHIILPSGKVHSPMSLSLPSIDSAFDSVFKYQLIQERPDLFVLRYVPSEKELTDSTKAKIAERIRRACLGEDIRMEFESVGDIPRGRTGKIHKFVSKLNVKGFLED